MSTSILARSQGLAHLLQFSGVLPSLVPSEQKFVIRPGGELRFLRQIKPAPKLKAKPDPLPHAIALPASTRSFWFFLYRSIYLLHVNQESASPVGGGAPLAFMPNFTPFVSYLHSLIEGISHWFSHSKIGSPGYGSLSQQGATFTAHARRSLRWSAAAIEERFGTKNCFFLTGTLPGSTSQALETFAAWSSWLMDRLQKWLRKHYSIDGDLYHCGVWEYQKRGALHYHALIATYDESILNRFKGYWWGLLRTISLYSGVDLFARSRGGSWSEGFDLVGDVAARAVRVEHTVKAYLSKYIGKGSQAFTPGSPAPARWWGRTRAVKALVDELTVTLGLPPLSEEDSYKVDNFVRGSLEDECEIVLTMTIPKPWYSKHGEYLGSRTPIGCIAFCWDRESAYQLALDLKHQIDFLYYDNRNIRAYEALECAVRLTSAIAHAEELETEFWASYELEKHSSYL